jgi:hypothetical protein
MAGDRVRLMFGSMGSVVQRCLNAARPPSCPQANNIIPEVLARGSISNHIDYISASEL